MGRALDGRSSLAIRTRFNNPIFLVRMYVRRLDAPRDHDKPAREFLPIFWASVQTRLLETRVSSDSGKKSALATTPPRRRLSHHLEVLQHVAHRLDGARCFSLVFQALLLPANDAPAER